MNITKERKTMAAAIGSSIILVPATAMATDPTPVADITTAVNSIGTLNSTLIGVALVALSYRVGVKVVNRFMTKG